MWYRVSEPVFGEACQLPHSPRKKKKGEALAWLGTAWVSDTVKLTSQTNNARSCRGEIGVACVGKRRRIENQIKQKHSTRHSVVGGIRETNPFPRLQPHRDDECWPFDIPGERSVRFR